MSLNCCRRWRLFGKPRSFAYLMTPGGLSMSVALTNCGQLCWTSNRHDYLYTATDPSSGQPWSAVLEVFLQLAQAAATQAGFNGFAPDACLVNRYELGAKLALRQDKNEQDYKAPIVSVSLIIPSLFLFDEHTRSDKAERVPLFHGDMVAWDQNRPATFHISQGELDWRWQSSRIRKQEPECQAR